MCQGGAEGEERPPHPELAFLGRCSASLTLLLSAFPVLYLSELGFLKEATVGFLAQF